VYSRHKQHDKDEAAEGKEGMILQRFSKRYLQQNTDYMAQRTHPVKRNQEYHQQPDAGRRTASNR